ncbi:MAG: hypothetical protein KGL39_22975 [Patescibacteria group bacterium]|nr:hypothetical protein [Patescibacteria group bacterium]
MSAPNDFTPGCSMKRVCSWCQAFLGLATCGQDQHGQVTHTICDECQEKYFGARILKQAAQFEEVAG